MEETMKKGIMKCEGAWTRWDNETWGKSARSRERNLQYNAEYKKHGEKKVKNEREHDKTEKRRKLKLYTEYKNIEKRGGWRLNWRIWARSMRNLQINTEYNYMGKWKEEITENEGQDEVSMKKGSEKSNEGRDKGVRRGDMVKLQ